MKQAWLWQRLAAVIALLWMVASLSGDGRPRPEAPPVSHAPADEEFGEIHWYIR